MSQDGLVDRVFTKLLIISVTKRIPWVGAGIGIILGVCLVLADQLIPVSPVIAVSRRGGKIGVSTL